MGFLDRFSKKEEKVKEEKVPLKDVEDFVGNKIKKDFGPLKESIKEEYSNLKLVADEMQGQLKALEEATYPERTYPVLINKAVGNRKSFIEKMRFLVKQVQRPMGPDMKSILDLYDETDKLISNTNLETTKEYAFLKILFEKEGKEVVQSFRRMVEINDRIVEMLKAPRESSSKLPRIREAVSEVSKLTAELKRDEVDELKTKLKENENKVKEVEGELEKLTHDDGWKKLLDMQSAEEELKARMQAKRSDFMECMSRLEVPLKKYRWSVENRTLDGYLQKSFESVLYDDPRGKVLMSALRDIMAEIKEGRMDLKDRDEFITVIESMIENNVIGKIIEDYLRFSEEVKDQEEKISSQEISKRKAKLESEMSRLKAEAEAIKKFQRGAEERMRRIQAIRDQEIKKLEGLLCELSGRKVLVVE